MTPELAVLTLAALLQVIQFGIYSVTANLQVGTKTALGPRDTPIVLTGTAGRAQRAMNNHFEGLVLYGIAASVLTYSDQATGKTALLAYLYLAARITYVPCYLFGLSPWRSIVWFAGFGATTLMLILALI